MKKMKEVEYVGVEDVHELLDLAAEMHKAGHYVSLDFANFGYQVCVKAILGGFEMSSLYDMSEDFHLGEAETDVAAMNRAKQWMNAVLADPAENKAVEVVG